MKKSEFRTPLLQSAAVLGGVLVLFAIVASSGASSSGGGILAIIFGIGNLILFFIGMGIALSISIALLIAIFLAAVAMVDAEQASNMYADLKKNFSVNALTTNRVSNERGASGTSIDKEEYDRMKQEIAQLHDKNQLLQGNINDISGNNQLLQGSIETLNDENSSLKEQLEELGETVEHLQISEKEIKELVTELTAKVEAGADPEMKAQMKKLEKLHTETQKDIATLMKRLQTLEESENQLLTTGIFTYIETADQQNLFIEKTKEAIAQELTYAQIDEYFTKNLPEALDTIIKDHPSLTKAYIREQRKE